MPRKLPRSLTVRPARRQGRLEEVRYKKSDDGQYYRHESDADLWLVTMQDGRRATLTVPRRGQGWTRAGRTTWLTNAPERKTSMAKQSKKSKRPMPAGLKRYWANKRRASGKAGKRAKTGKAVTRSVTTRTFAVNRPKSKKRRHRRNPPLMSFGGVLERVTNGAIGGATIVATENVTRVIRRHALKMKDGEALSVATEVGLGTAAGLATEWALGGRMGERFGQLIVDASFASGIRTVGAQIKAKLTDAPEWVKDLLGDNGARVDYEIHGGRVIPIRGRRINGYVNGYVDGSNRRPPLGFYVSGPNPAYAMASNGAGGGG